MAAHAPCGLPRALLASWSEEAAASPHLTASGAGPCSRTSPRRRKAPPAGGETCIAAALARGRALLPGRSLGFPIDRVAERLAGRALLRDRRWHAPDCRVLASDPRSSPDLLLRPSLGAGSDVACARVGGVSPRMAKRYHPLRASARVVRFPPRRFAPRADFQGVAPGAGPGSDRVSPPRARRPPLAGGRSRPSSCARCGNARQFPAVVAFTPLEEPASSALTRRGREPRTRRTASPRPLPPCRFYGFEALLRRRVRTSYRSLRIDARPVLPWASFPSKVLRCRSINRDATPARALRHLLAKATRSVHPAPFRSRTSRARPASRRGEDAAVRTRRSRHQEIETQASRSQRDEPKLGAPRTRAAAPRRNEESRTVPGPVGPSLQGFAEPGDRRIVRDAASATGWRPRSLSGAEVREVRFIGRRRVASRCGRRRVPRRPSWGS